MDEKISGMNAVLVFSIFWGPILIAFIINQRIKKSKTARGTGWSINNGKQPALFNVDVVYANGKTKWYVPAKELLWAKSLENPIVKYRKMQPIE